MRVSELIDELLKIKLCRGDIEVVLHDSSCGYDFDDFSVYVDDGGADPDECIVGFGNDSDKRPEERWVLIEVQEDRGRKNHND